MLDFCGLPGAWKESVPRKPFYEPFFGAFKAYRSPTFFEPNVWLWVVDEEKSAAVVSLFHEKFNTEYELYHNTYIQAKTEGVLVMLDLLERVKQLGAIGFYFLTHKKSPSGRLQVKASTAFKKMYELSQPHSKDLVQELLDTTNPKYELSQPSLTPLLNLVIHPSLSKGYER